MPSDKLDALGPLLGDIGTKLVSIADGATSGLFLYVEACEGGTYTSIFKDEGAQVRYLDWEKTGLYDFIIAAREAEPDVTKRWSVMEYEVEDGKFEAKFKFPDEVNVEADVGGDRREVVLRERYGDKPVVYPPPPWDAEDLMPEDS